MAFTNRAVRQISKYPGVRKINISHMLKTRYSCSLQS